MIRARARQDAGPSLAGCWTLPFSVPAITATPSIRENPETRGVRRQRHVDRGELEISEPRREAQPEDQHVDGDPAGEAGEMMKTFMAADQGSKPTQSLPNHPMPHKPVFASYPALSGPPTLLAPDEREGSGRTDARLAGRREGRLGRELQSRAVLQELLASRRQLQLHGLGTSG